jgi:hypothetical protein
MPLMLFIMLYPPCVLAISATCREIGIKEGIKIVITTFAFAYLSAFVFYTFSLIGNIFGFLALGVLIILVYLLKFIKVSPCITCNNLKKCKNSRTSA